MEKSKNEVKVMADKANCLYQITENGNGYDCKRGQNDKAVDLGTSQDMNGALGKVRKDVKSNFGKIWSMRVE